MKFLRSGLIILGLALVVWGLVQYLEDSRLEQSIHSAAIVYSRTSTPVQASTTSPIVTVAKLISPFIMVTRVIDGDTIEIETGELVRYIGVNAPESIHPIKPVQCFGHEASEWNRQLVEGKTVRLVKDVSEVDHYERLLRYVYLPDGTFVNLELVKQGYGYAATFPPDVKYSRMFVQAAREAREKKRGLWDECKKY